MSEKVSLKGTENLVPINRIYRELAAMGIQPVYQGRAVSDDGKFVADSFADERALYQVCDMLVEARRMLEKEKQKNKKRWQFWK